MNRRGAVVIVAASAVVACISKVDADPDTVLTNPNDPSETVSTTSNVVSICGTICDALIEEYGVPADLRSACVYECAVGFDRAPEACYQLVSCVADRSLCSANDISAPCLERAGECLPHWSLANGSCRNCWQPSRTVRGKQVVTYLNETTPSSVPEDFSKLEIAALLPRAPLSPYRFPGTGNADGTYSIKSVPGCGVWIQVGTTYTWSGNADVDTSYSVQARTGFTVGAPGTAAVITAIGLVPWTDEDWFYLFAPQVSTFNAYLPPYDPGDVDFYIPPGSTGATFTIDLSSQGLPEEAKKDTVFLHQLSAKPGPAGSFVRTVTRTARLTDVTIADGQQNARDVTLSEIVPNKHHRLEFKRGSFEALQGDLHPASQKGFAPGFQPKGSLSIWGHPGRERVGATGEIVLIDRDSQDGDIPPIEVDWANPFDASWGIDLYAGVTWFVPLTDRNGVLFRGGEEVSVTEPLDRWNGGAVVPRVSPPRNVRIDGRPATTAIADPNLSLTPTITWDAPSLGEPERYEVIVRSLVKGNPAFPRTGTIVASMIVPRLPGQTAPPLKAVTLPPGILQRGTDYHFTVIASVRKTDERNDVAAVATSEYRP